MFKIGRRNSTLRRIHQSLMSHRYVGVGHHNDSSIMTHRLTREYDVFQIRIKHAMTLDQFTSNLLANNQSITHNQ